MKNIFFNAQHSPLGAFASFTLGFKGASGGLGLELGRPANQQVYLGVESLTPNRFQILPFCEGAVESRTVFEGESAGRHAPPELTIAPFADEEIRRDFKAATDTWQAGDLTFRIYSLVRSIPDPATATPEALRQLLIPAVLVDLTIDNTRGTQPRRAFFGYAGRDPCTHMRRLDETGSGRLIGVGQGRLTAIATRDQGARACLNSLPRALAGCPQHGLDDNGILVLQAEPGRKTTFPIAVCFYRAGFVTAGLDAAYFYTRYFRGIEEVAEFALANAHLYRMWAEDVDAMFSLSGLSDARQFMLAQAIRGYYGSTELLETEGRPFWVVNEGEYRMMNTFDLTVDHLFFELKMNGWTVRNVLDQFVGRYSYRDQVHAPGDPAPLPGGISFTHDMGVANAVSRPGRSVYEREGESACFSFMTHEQLVNWICCAAVYVHTRQDDPWLRRNRRVFGDCLESLVNRDHHDPARRTGLMKLDSNLSRSEITTYDSLDTSLRQARGNLYLGVKTWAAYVLLEKMLIMLEENALAEVAGAQAQKAAATIAAQADADGALPAVLESGGASRIIPIVEGLVFPWKAGCREALLPDGRFGALIRALRRHLDIVLRKGVCQFASGAWKLSSTSENSWLSKTYLCQFVAQTILRWPGDMAEADAAHAAWLTDPDNAYWAFSDQIVAGKAKGSKYYPRGVTAILWLED